MDTNALSAYADGVAGAVTAVDEAESIELPVIALGEYRFGVSYSRRIREYEAWLTKFLRVCRVLEITEETAESYARVRSELKDSGTPFPSNDLWIAALSRQLSLPVLSRDRHFDVVQGLRRVAW